jgi:hypothetical protein
MDNSLSKVSDLRGKGTSMPVSSGGPTSSWGDSESFRRDHAISEEVWNRRGYGWYRSGADGVTDLGNIDEGYKNPAIREAVERRTRVPGLAIRRRALPGTREKPKPLAELRPDRPLPLYERWHAHPGPKNHTHDYRDPFRPCHKNRHPPGSRRRGHHRHVEEAKYLFLPAEMVERVWLAPVMPPGVDLWDWIANDTAAQLSKRVGGDVTAPWNKEVLEKRLGLELPEGEVTIDGVVYKIESRMGKAAQSEAMRIDVNPLAWDMLRDAERVYLGAEGCIKADAMLTDIIRRGEKATVFSWPSVTLWPHDTAFYDGDLRYVASLDVELVVVLDADYDSPKNKGAVIAQSSRVQDDLVRLGATRTRLAAPPSQKGIDDYLALPGTSLGECVVLEARSGEVLIDQVQETFDNSNGQVVFETVATTAHQIVLRSNPHEEIAHVYTSHLANNIVEEEVRPSPTGAAPTREKAYALRHAQDAAERKVRRAQEPLSRAGVKVHHPEPVEVDGETFIPPTEYQLPTGSAPMPKVLGTLDEVGVPPVERPSFKLKTACAQCGRRFVAERRSARYCSPNCQKAASRERMSG